MESLEKKTARIKNRFATCQTKEQVYHTIILIGKELPPLPIHRKSENLIVPGCQSIVYLYSSFENGRIFYQAESEGLISQGLAALLTLVYSGEPPETVLKSTPDYIEEIGLKNSLTPNRANGIHSIHLRMKQDALKALLG